MFRSEDLFEGMRKAMLERARDTIPAVRTQACAALSRLQDPSDNTDPVLNKYLQLMAKDVSK